MLIQEQWPIKIESEANKREHHLAKARRTAAQRSIVRAMWSEAGRTKDIELPVLVHLVRLGPRGLDDDNLANGFKHVRDELAICLLPPQTRTVIRHGVTMTERWADDSDPRLLFTYSQERSKKYAIRVEVHHATAEELSLMRNPIALLGLVRESNLGRPAPNP